MSNEIRMPEQGTSNTIFMPSATPGVAIKRQPKSEIEIQPIYPEGLSKAFISEAERFDVLIQETVEILKRDVSRLGELFQTMQDKAFHTALGFTNFRSYLVARWPDRSPALIFRAMRIHRELTAGPTPTVTVEDVRAMTADNAESLAKLKKQGVKITPEIIAEAKTMRVFEFKAKVFERETPSFAPSVSDSARPPQIAIVSADPMVREYIRMTREVSALRGQCFEICRYLLKKELEDIPGPAVLPESWENEAWSAIFGEFIGTYAAEYEQAKQAEAAQALQRAQKESAKMGSIMIEGKANIAPLPQAAQNGTQATQADQAVIPICLFIKDDFKRCGSPATRGERYCYYHITPGRALEAEVAALEAE